MFAFREKKANENNENFRAIFSRKISGENLFW
jgi:hypothetical protein